MNDDIELTRAQLIGQEMGLSRPAIPDDGQLLPAGVWIITGQLPDGTCGMGVAECDAMPAQELVEAFAEQTYAEMGAVLGHARHVDTGAVLFFAQQDRMADLGEYIAAYEATQREMGAK